MDLSFFCNGTPCNLFMYLEIYFVKAYTNPPKMYVFCANMHIVICMFYLQVMVNVIFYFNTFLSCFPVFIYIFFIACHFANLFHLL